MNQLLFLQARASSSAWIILMVVAMLFVWRLIKSYRESLWKRPRRRHGQERSALAQPDRQDLVRTRTAGSEAVFAGKRLLLADDSETIRRAVAMTLEPEGFQMLYASDGVEALRILKQQHPDLLVIEENLHTFDGIQLCEVVRRDELLRDLPVVLLTGTAFDTARAERAGVSATVPKPFETDALLEAIRRSLAQSPLHPICPHCGHAVGDEVTTCFRCGAAHHPECWKLLDGCGHCGPLPSP